MDGGVYVHRQQNFIIKEDSTCIGHKGSSDPIENVQVLEDVPSHAMNAPYAFIEQIMPMTLNANDVESNKETIVSDLNSTGSSLELNSGENSGTGLGFFVDPGREVTSVSLGHKHMGLLSFDKACSIVRNLRRRNKKVLADLGWNVECSRSYYKCLSPRTSNRNGCEGKISPSSNGRTTLEKEAVA